MSFRQLSPRPREVPPGPCEVPKNHTIISLFPCCPFVVGCARVSIKNRPSRRAAQQPRDACFRLGRETEVAMQKTDKRGSRLASWWMVFGFAMMLMAAIACGQQSDQGTAQKNSGPCPAGQVATKGWELGQGMVSCGGCAIPCNTSASTCGDGG